MKYKIEKEPKMTAPHNIKTWKGIKSRMGSGSTSYEDIVGWCLKHKFKGDGKVFINYCTLNDWHEAID